MKSILIVGGAGYIGSHVTLEFLNHGFKVTVLDNLSSGQQINLFPQADFIHGDIQDRVLLGNIFKDNQFDGVIHLAALKAAGESMFKPEKYSHQNISGTLNLLEAISLSDTKIIVFSSTAAVYGMPQYLPTDEKHPLNPINYYGFTKLEVERILSWYDQLKGIKSGCLRYFNAAGYDTEGRVKGLEKNPANLLPIVLEAACGIREEMQVFGDDYPTPDGTGIRDYIHVSDLASAHLKAFEKIEKSNESLTVNLATEKGISVLEMIQMTEKISGRKVNYKIVDRRAGDPAELYAKSDLAKELLDWTPKHSDLKTLIESTWNVYKGSLGIE